MTYTIDRISIHHNDDKKKGCWLLAFSVGDSVYHTRLRGALDFKQAKEQATERIGRELDWELGENRWSGRTYAIAQEVALDREAIQRMTYAA